MLETSDLTRLTVFYTQDLAGDLSRLPRLYSLIETLRLRYGAALLLDLGGQCAPDVWHCAVTEGRSAIVALDGMGYHAANVAHTLSEASRQKLLGSVMMGLVDERRAWRYHVPPVMDEGIVISLDPVPALRLNVVLTPADATRLEHNTLHVQRVPAWTVGVAQLDLRDLPTLVHTAEHPLTDAHEPHPTIAAVVELVLEEADWLRQRGG
ncbi:hypothetical protein VZO05_14790 [Aggregatilineales bacterium SYSU G02658]